MSFRNSDRAVYSDLNPPDGGQSLYPMSTTPKFVYGSYLTCRGGNENKIEFADYRDSFVVQGNGNGVLPAGGSAITPDISLDRDPKEVLFNDQAGLLHSFSVMNE